MIGDELLDAVALGVKSEELVRSGNQYIAIDLSTLDYIYSDSINRFINLNRAILDINGRIVIVAPHPKVFELLEKAGVLNFIKVCRSREELMRVSEMISPSSTQTPAPAAPAPAAPAPVAPAPVAPAPAPEQVEMPFSVNTETSDDDFAFQIESDPEQEAPSPFEQPAAPMVHEEHHPVAYESETAVDDLYSDGDSFVERKKNIVPLLTVLVILAVLLAGGVFFFLSSLHEDSKGTSVSELASEKSTETAAAETIPEEQSADKPSLKPHKMTKAEKKAAEKAKKAVQAAAAAAGKTIPAGADVISFKSSPSGVDILVNGEFIGTTPYSWKKPPIYGDVEIVFRKSGYEDKVQRIEYLGGKQAVSASLAKSGGGSAASAQSDDKKAQEARFAAEKAEMERMGAEKLAADKAAAEKAAQDRLAAERNAAEKAAADKLAAERAAEKQAAERAAEKAAAEKAAAARAAADKAAAEKTAADNASATIFFSSLPPMADIYEDGRLVGKTNVKPVVTKPGAHSYEFKKDGMTARYSATLRDGKNSAPMIRLE